MVCEGWEGEWRVIGKVNRGIGNVINCEEWFKDFYEFDIGEYKCYAYCYSCR